MAEHLLRSIIYKQPAPLSRKTKESNHDPRRSQSLAPSSRHSALSKAAPTPYPGRIPVAYRLDRRVGEWCLATANSMRAYQPSSDNVVFQNRRGPRAQSLTLDYRNLVEK